VIQNIADMKPKARYIVATDDSQTTLEEIVKVCLLFTAEIPQNIEVIDKSSIQVHVNAYLQ